jgi:dienelactone hydrolase
MLTFRQTGMLAVLLLSCARVGAADETRSFSEGALKLTYAEHLPAKPAAAKLGLVLLFHGHTGNETSLLGPAVGALEQAGVGATTVVIGLKSQGPGWEDRDDAVVKAFLKHALATYPVDPRRVIGMGYSSGCYYVTRFVQANPDCFAGGIGYVGSQFGSPSRGEPGKAADLFWVTGHKDTLQPYLVARAVALKNVAMGLPVVYREEKDMGHNFLYGQTSIEALAWMQHLRAKAVPLEADDAAFIASFQDEAKAKKQLADARTWARVVAIAGLQVGPVIELGLASDKPAVQNNALLACTKVQLDDAILTTLGKLLEGKDKKLKGAALNALLVHATWNHQLAQKIIADVALAEAAPSADRQAAALALAQAVKVDVQAACAYTRVLWALVDLLDAEDAGLRQTAFTALAPAVAGGFAYQPGANKAARAASVEQWHAWVEKQSGPRPAP